MDGKVRHYPLVFPPNFGLAKQNLAGLFFTARGWCSCAECSRATAGRLIGAALSSRRRQSIGAALGATERATLAVHKSGSTSSCGAALSAVRRACFASHCPEAPRGDVNEGRQNQPLCRPSQFVKVIGPSRDDGLPNSRRRPSGLGARFRARSRAAPTTPPSRDTRRCSRKQRQPTARGSVSLFVARLRQSE